MDQPQPIVSREEWLTERRALLVEEKAFTHQRDQLSERRRALPWVRHARGALARASISTSSPKAETKQAYRFRWLGFGTTMTTELGAQTGHKTWRAAGVAAPAWLIALLLPKCPLCLAALLTSLGMGATLSAGLAAWVQPIVLLWAGVGVALLLAAASVPLRRATRSQKGTANCPLQTRAVKAASGHCKSHPGATYE